MCIYTVFVYEDNAFNYKTSNNLEKHTYSNLFKNNFNQLFMLDDTLISIKQKGSLSVNAWRASEDNFCVFTQFSSITAKANYHSFILPLQFAFSEDQKYNPIHYFKSTLDTHSSNSFPLKPVATIRLSSSNTITRGIPRIPYNFAAAHSHPNST